MSACPNCGAPTYRPVLCECCQYAAEVAEAMDERLAKADEARVGYCEGCGDYRLLIGPGEQCFGCLQHGAA